MAGTVYAAGFKGGLGLSSSSFMAGEDYTALTGAMPTWVRVARPVRSRPMMKNVNEGKGVFAPAVVVTRNVIGKKTFNQLRGKAIALHSQGVGYSDPHLCCIRVVFVTKQWALHRPRESCMDQKQGMNSNETDRDMDKQKTIEDLLFAVQTIHKQE